MRAFMKTKREELGFTQAETAEKVGIARTTYTNIELGEKNPSFEIMLKLKEVFKVKKDDIFLNTNVPKSDKTECGGHKEATM